MKKLLRYSLFAFAISSSSLFAEGDGNKDWAEKAAQKYEQKAKNARDGGNEAAAKIYDRMAQIKRDAGSASKRGEKFSWDEYHKLEGELNALKGGHDKKHAWKDKGHEKKDHNKHGGKKDAGAGFLATADKYMKKANEAMSNGEEGKASIYTELANMKREAAAAAAKGEGYDWTRYFELKKRL